MQYFLNIFSSVCHLSQNYTMIYNSLIKGLGLCLFLSLSFQMTISAQADMKPIASSILEHDDDFEKMEGKNLVHSISYNPTEFGVEKEIGQASFFTLNQEHVTSLLRDGDELIVLELAYDVNKSFTLQLEKADIYAKGFDVYLASNRSRAFDYTPGLNYWGIANNDYTSLAAISLVNDELSGFISIDGDTYTIGKLDKKDGGVHIIYKTNDLKITPTVGCDTDDKLHYIGNDDNGGSHSPGDCVQMYIEVDYDIYNGKGGSTQALNYVTAAFSQVAILYANDGIEFALSEVVVWNIADPYTGPSTSNYLTQFRDELNGTYNGDLAHLVGYSGGGGIAYVDVLCNGFYGVGYSAINSTYGNVPTYSWTIEVLTHEIGHNLGSSHTHACVWNGNGTAIDG